MLASMVNILRQSDTKYRKTAMRQVLRKVCWIKNFKATSSERVEWKKYRGL